MEREHKREEIKGKSEWNRMKRKSERRQEQEQKQWHTNCPKTTGKMKADERFVEQEYQTKNIVSFKFILAHVKCLSASKQGLTLLCKKVRNIPKSVLFLLHTILNFFSLSGT